MWDAHAYCSIRAIVFLGVDNNTFPNISQRGEKTAPCVRCLHYVCVHVYPGAGVTDREMGKIRWEYAEKIHKQHSVKVILQLYLQQSPQEHLSILRHPDRASDTSHGGV